MYVLQSQAVNNNNNNEKRVIACAKIEEKQKKKKKKEKENIYIPAFNINFFSHIESNSYSFLHLPPLLNLISMRY